MSWKGILRKGGIISDGENIEIKGYLRSRNLWNTQGNIFFADSVNGNSGYDGKDPRNALDSARNIIENGLVSANNGDVIVCLPGHIETVSAAGYLDLDIAGLTIIFLGYGADQAYIDFTTVVGADVDIDAASITLIRPKFVTGKDALTGPIDVNAADFTIVDGLYMDAAGKAATDCIVATAAATRLTIDGWRFIESTTGTQKQSNIQLNGVDDTILKNIDIRGDFATGNIENVADEVLNIRLEDHELDNLNSGPAPCIVLDSNADGLAKNVKCRVASGTTYVSNVADLNWDRDCEGFSTDGYGGEPIGTAIGSGVEGKVDTIDGYHDVPTKDVATNTVMRDVVGVKTDSAAEDAVSEEESLMAYAKQNVTLAIARDAVIGALNTAAAAGAVTDADLMMAYIKQLVTAAIAEAAQSLKIDGVTLAVAPVANSLAAFVASGGTVLGQELPDSQSLIDIIGDFTGPHDGAAQDDNVMASLDLAHTDLDTVISQANRTSTKKAVASVTTANLFTVAGGAVRVLGIVGHVTTGLEAAANNTKLVHTSTGGAAVDLCAVLNVTGSAIRKALTITGTKANAMTLSADEGVIVDNMAAKVVLTPGIISLNCAATTTGGIDWYILYEPMASGAVITAVA